MQTNISTSNQPTNFLRAVDLCTTLSNLDRSDRCSRDRIKAALKQELNIFFTTERREALIADAPGGRDLAGHAVRYFRSMEWSELAILLRNDGLKFPDLHAAAGETLIPTS